MKKKILIGIVVIVCIISILWLSGMIPKQIAKVSAINYLKNAFPNKEFEFENIEWYSTFGAYSIRFKDENNETIGFLMNNKYFPIHAGQGTFALEEKYRVENGNITGINDVYLHSATKNYTDIRSLPKDYSEEQAQQDNCFVIGSMVHNDYLYTEFIEKYNKNESAFIRVVQSTTEGDIFIIDLLYDSKENKIHFIKDDTRDIFSAENDRTIKYKTYEKTGIWNYQGEKYWVVYNGELPDGLMYQYTINPDELFIIASFGSGSTM